MDSGLMLLKVMGKVQERSLDLHTERTKHVGTKLHLSEPGAMYSSCTAVWGNNEQSGAGGCSNDNRLAYACLITVIRYRFIVRGR